MFGLSGTKLRIKLLVKRLLMRIRTRSRRLGFGLVDPDRVLTQHYSHHIQMSLGQVHAILAAIAMAGPSCKLLIFGCGNDSDFWQEANARGKTVFLENHPAWLAKARACNPALDIRQVDYGDRTVVTSLPIRESDLAAVPMPDVMTEEAWDVFIIDSPMGHKDDSPGRGLPIYWTSKVATPAAQVFVDDYERDLEREYADYFLNVGRTWRATIPRLAKHGQRSSATMLWSMGTGAKNWRRLGKRRLGRGAVILLADRGFLPGLHTLTYSLRRAIAEDTHDIVVMTNDRSVADDEVVRRIAHHIHVISDGEISEIRRINASRVANKLRHAQLGKFNFLKFYAFRDMGYSHHIFLDVDMICLSPKFRFEDVCGDYDFAAAPTMGAKFLSAERSSATVDEHLIDRVRKLMQRRPHAARSFNSGLFFVDSGLLGDDTIDQLISIGESWPSRFEQTITAAFVTTRPGLKFHSLSVALNFTEAAARALGKVDFGKMKETITFLHFNTNEKPWERHGSFDWLDMIWHEYGRKANEWWAAELTKG